MLPAADPDGDRGNARGRHEGPTGSGASLRVIGPGNDIPSVENLEQSVVVALFGFDQVRVSGQDGEVGSDGLDSEGLQGTPGEHGCPESSGTCGLWRGPGERAPGEEDRAENTPDSKGVSAYTEPMTAVDHEATAALLPAESDVPKPVADPVSHLTAVYRDYPGLRALILRRVRDPEVAADILQDAAVTTLEKLRSGEIAHPENVGGYLYRVALNHLRNHRRKDRTALSSAEALSELIAPEELEWERVGRPQWAEAARRLLEEMPAARDRELLVRFYLNDEAKGQICRELRLSEEHFNRVIFRARHRFRELIERRGFWKADLLAIVAISFCVAVSAAALFAPPAYGAHACSSNADHGSAAVSGAVR